MPLDPFWLSLLAKMAVTAAFVVIATKAAEQAGALVGAMIATLPIAAGPSYVFLALDHGPQFLADGALASLTVNAVTAIYALVYASLAQRHGLTFSLAIALAVWAGAAALARSLPWTTTTSVIFNIVVFAGCLAAGDRFGHVKMPPVTRRWYDVPLRAGLVSVLVAAVVGLSTQVGPRITGTLAVFPIVLTSLILILHPRVGGPPTAAIIAHTILGLIGFSLCCLTARLLIVPLGAPLGLGLALTVSVCANLALWALRRSLARQAA